MTFGCLSFEVRNLCEPLNVSVRLLNTPLHIRCGIICSVGEIENYINVTPEDVQYLSPDEVIIYTVKSNMTWEITAIDEYGSE